MIKKIFFWLKRIHLMDLSAQFDFLLKFKCRAIVYKNLSFKSGKGSSILTKNGVLSLGMGWLPNQIGYNLLILECNSSLIVDGDFIFFSGYKFIINRDAKVEIGSGYINNGSEIECFSSIKIGKGCEIGRNVTIRDGDSKVIRDGGGFIVNMPSPIVINDNVWIGDGAKILKGVNIGRGAIIAAGSIVTTNCDEYAVYAGVPAKKIKENVFWSSN